MFQDTERCCYNAVCSTVHHPLCQLFGTPSVSFRSDSCSLYTRRASGPVFHLYTNSPCFFPVDQFVYVGFSADAYRKCVLSQNQESAGKCLAEAPQRQGLLLQGDLPWAGDAHRASQPVSLRVFTGTVRSSVPRPCHFVLCSLGSAGSHRRVASCVLLHRTAGCCT